MVGDPMGGLVTKQHTNECALNECDPYNQTISYTLKPITK
jgi:hypothetical protein